jgi:hypothetical protein
MVETNNDDERGARIDHMLETLQREPAPQKAMTAKSIEIVQPALSKTRLPARKEASTR